MRMFPKRWPSGLRLLLLHPRAGNPVSRRDSRCSLSSFIRRLGFGGRFGFGFRLGWCLGIKIKAKNWYLWGLIWIYNFVQWNVIYIYVSKLVRIYIYIYITFTLYIYTIYTHIIAATVHLHMSIANKNIQFVFKWNSSTSQSMVPKICFKVQLRSWWFCCQSWRR